VGDSRLDNQKLFARAADLQQKFVFRVGHLERTVQVYKDRLKRWESKSLQDWVNSVPAQVTFQVGVLKCC